MPESELSEITEALDKIAIELDSDPDEDRAAQLVREASELAAKAGEALERAQRAVADAADAG